MNESPCQWLDDYLDRDLTDEELERFQKHLQHCAACSEQVSHAVRLRGCLAAAVEALDSPPIVRVRSARNGRRVAIATLAIAAAIAIFAVWLAHNPLPPPSQPISSPPLAAAAPPVQVTFPKDDVIAIPIESGSPNVTVLMVYPVVRVESDTHTERSER